MFKQVSIDTAQGRIEGHYDPKFSAVYAAFVENFELRDEVGASCALTLDGQAVVDLWGGRVTRGGAAWTRDTISMVFSATKKLVNGAISLL